MGLLDRGVEIKTPEQIDLMRARRPAGRARPSSCCAARAGPGSPPASSTRSRRTTSARTAASRRSWATATRRSPATICASVNDEVVHGIPGVRELVEGDVISIDCGAIVDGWHGDAAITVAIGEVPAEVTELMRVTEEALWAGIAAARLGGRVTDISHAVETSVRAHGDYGILEDYVGHGIGTQMHMPPNVPNVGRPGRGPEAGAGPGARRGADGHPRHATRPTCSTDEWTVVTADGSLRRPLRAHLHPHPERRLGAHRPRRRRGAARRPRRPVRRPLSPSASPSRPRVSSALIGRFAAWT